MNISWKWLLEYVDYGGTLKDAVGLLTMAGLNVDSVEELPGGDALGDALLDVEVTSNRPDCLGHVGVARELAETEWSVRGSEARLTPPESCRATLPLTPLISVEPAAVPSELLLKATTLARSWTVMLPV